MSLDLQCDNVEITNNQDGVYEVKILPEISTENLISTLDKVYSIELAEDFKDTILLRLKGLNAELLHVALKHSLEREDIKDPLMILNIINTIKIYNTLDESFFDTEDSYYTSIEDFIDVKLLLADDVKNFCNKLSFYFISLFKTYNKYAYTPSDNRVELPNLYRIILLSTDIMTLSGIFASYGKFDTKECVYIQDGITILTQLLMKHSISMSFFDNFARKINEQEEQNGDSTE